MKALALIVVLVIAGRLGNVTGTGVRKMHRVARASARGGRRTRDRLERN
jgi:hypothetical protein